MPHYNIWIREADDKAWKGITNRSEFIHKSLSKIDIPEIEVIKAELDNSPVSRILDRVERGLKFCKHGVDPQFCKFAKPGKPCK